MGLFFWARQLLNKYTNPRYFSLATQVSAKEWWMKPEWSFLELSALLKVFPKRWATLGWLKSEVNCKEPSCTARFTCTIIIFQAWCICSFLESFSLLNWRKIMKTETRVLSTSTSFVTSWVNAGEQKYGRVYGSFETFVRLPTFFNFVANKIASRQHSESWRVTSSEGENHF